MIKSKVSETGENKTVEFPKLMKHKRTGLIVLFDSEESGMVVAEGHLRTYRTGEYRTDWISSSFYDYNEPVTIQNVVN